VRLYTDAMLGTLTSYLRFLGHDTVYALDDGVEADDTVLKRVRETDRTLLTRDRDLAERAPASVLLAGHEIEEQLRELSAAGFDLELSPEPTRCGVCNGSLERVGADESTPEYAPGPEERAVWRCRECGQHFWKGSHWADVRRRIAAVG
jgi:uncharacterized protein with PIN domain